MASQKLTLQELDRLLNSTSASTESTDNGLGPSFLHLLATAGRQLLSKLLTEHHYEPGQIIFQEGEMGDTMYIIWSGRVAIIKGSFEAPTVLGFRGVGEIIGEMALLDYGPRSAGVVAIEKTSTLELKRVDFMEILEGYPDLALFIIQNLSRRLRHNTSYIEEITNLSRHVAIGDYSSINESQIEQTHMETGSENDKVDQLMAEFVAMVRGIREREDDLRKQVQKLTLQIDERKRRREVEEIVNADFYAPLKEQAKKLRAQRKDKK